MRTRPHQEQAGGTARLGPWNLRERAALPAAPVQTSCKHAGEMRRYCLDNRPAEALKSQILSTTRHRLKWPGAGSNPGGPTKFLKELRAVFRGLYAKNGGNSNPKKTS